MATAAVAVQPAERSDLHGARLAAAWLGYAALVGFMVFNWIPSLPAMFERYRAILPDVLWIWTAVAALVDTAIAVSIGLFILWRRPREGIAIFTSFALVTIGFDHSGALGLGPQGSFTIFWLQEFTVGNGAILLLPFVFPDGRFVPRWGFWYWLVLFVGTEVLPLFLLSPADAIQFPFYGIDLMLLGGVVAQVQRYRHFSAPLQRIQTKWFTFGYLTFMVFWELNLRLSNFLFHRIFLGVPAESPGLSQLIFNTAMSTAQRAAGAVIPIAILIAILRWQLFKIDLIINRALVYGALTAILVALFAVGTAVLEPLLAGLAGGAVIGNAATGLVAVGAFLPLRRRLQAVADRYVPARALVTLYFMDLVSSTNTAVALGDEQWRQTLDRYRSAVRREIARSKGREVDNAMDGFFATFSSPADALRGADRIRKVVLDLGLHSRTGIHIGECEIHGSKVTGINVITAARVMSEAEADEILVSSTIRDLVSGSQMRFADRGMHQLKGLPEPYLLYAFVG